MGKATIISSSAFVNDKVVKICVPSFDALVEYQPQSKDEITIVVAEASLPKDDLKKLENYCRELNYSFEGIIGTETAAAAEVEATTTSKSAEATTTSEAEAPSH